MRLKLIACKALFRECSLLSAQSGHFIDATFMRQGLHDTPALLHEALQEEIDGIDQARDIHTLQPRAGVDDFDAIVLGYGLCSNAVIGLRSARYALVIPRCDDCIALLLGSYARYREYFDKHPGTFWYSASWIENAYTPSPGKDAALLAEYEAKYGQDNARYLMEGNRLTRHYSRCAYVDWEELALPRCYDYAREAARHYGWEFDHVRGHKAFLHDLLNGNWDDRFLVVPPGGKIVAEYSGRLIAAGEQNG